MKAHLKRFALEALENPHNPYSEHTKGDIHCFDDKELFRYTMFVVTECIYSITKQRKNMTEAEAKVADFCTDTISKDFQSVMKAVVE